MSVFNMVTGGGGGGSGMLKLLHEGTFTGSNSVSLSLTIPVGAESGQGKRYVLVASTTTNVTTTYIVESLLLDFRYLKQNKTSGTFNNTGSCVSATSVNLGTVVSESVYTASNITFGYDDDQVDIFCQSGSTAVKFGSAYTYQYSFYEFE